MARSRAGTKRALACGVWAVVALTLVALARGLPPDTFFVGDPGVKLIVARHAIANPTHPLELPLPVIGRAIAPYVDPFFVVHGDHAHAVTSELFPLASAPFIAWLGLRGAYVLPAIGFLTAIACCGWLGVALDDRRSPAAIMTVAALCTPLLFYGLEFWEHAPAVGIGVFATVLLVRHPARLAFPSGLLFGIAALLRPEALWWAVAVLAGGRLLRTPLRLPALLASAGGFVVAYLPVPAYTFGHFGSIVSPHVAGNGVLAAGTWMPGGLALRWFVDVSAANFWRVAPAMLLAFVPLPASAQRGGRSFLWAVALLDAALVVATAPNDGGGQWGPRYLLFAYVPLTILAADVCQAGARHKPAAMIAVVLALVGSAWIQRTSYKELRGAKLAYGRVLDFVASEVPTGGTAVTDVWWLDQVAAAATADRQLLYAPDDRTAGAILHRLDEAGIRNIATIRARADSSDTLGGNGVAVWTRETCYIEEGAPGTVEPGLVAIQLQRTCEKARGLPPSQP